MPRLLVVLLLLLGASPAAAEAVDVPALSAALAEYNRGAKYPLPPLDEARMKRLLDGKIVKLREVKDDDAPQRGIGLWRVHGFDMDSLWIAGRDVHFGSVEELTEVPLSDPVHYPVRWYQYLDLPRPFTDRHWMVDSSPTVPLARATEGRCWEYSWGLTPDGPAIAKAAVAAGEVPGIDSHAADDAIYVPVNHGAWLYIRLPDDSIILGYHATSVVGGRIPEKLVADYTMLTLGSVLKGVLEKVPKVRAHYDAAHKPIRGGDGEPISPTAP